MFKTLKFSAIIFIILLSATTHTAFATTWVDNVANKVTFNPGHGSSGDGNSYYSFTYDITGSGDALNLLSDPSNPFHPGKDTISSADLFLNFHFGNDDQNAKTADIYLDGIDQTPLHFAIDDAHFDASGIASLNDNGTLRLDIRRISGTFQLTDSRLTANGTDNTLTQPDPPTQPTQPSIPEPSTFFLLGAGLLGVGFVRMRIKR